MVIVYCECEKRLGVKGKQQKSKKLFTVQWWYNARLGNSILFTVVAQKNN